jgi:hypothetical protein
MLATLFYIAQFLNKNWNTRHYGARRLITTEQTSAPTTPISIHALNIAATRLQMAAPTFTRLQISSPTHPKHEHYVKIHCDVTWVP